MKPLALSLLVLLLLSCSPFVAAQNEKPECPTISVTGPGGIIEPGDTATFTANVADPQRFGPLQYKWTFTGGEILKGQDTTALEVRAKKTMPVQIYATVRVLGLPQGCLDTAAEKVEFFGEPFPVSLDEFDRLANAAVKTRLDEFFAELKKHPHNQGYIINYGTDKAIQAREKLILANINFRKFDSSRITLVRGGYNEGHINTKLYRIPPGADNPVP